METLLEQIFSSQQEFQDLLGIKFSEMDSQELDSISEVYLYKLIEEVIELRRTQPSGLMVFSKRQPTINRDRMMKELADCFLYLINFCLARQISFESIVNYCLLVQDNNFRVTREKMLKLEVPNEIV